MKFSVGRASIELVRGDISRQEVDVIVTAANTRLAGGGGVDGAVHSRGGPSIPRELREKYPSGCATGDAVVTQAGSLQAKFVIHAVGPIYDPEQDAKCRELLGRAYKRALQLAEEQGCCSIAFPAISTGVYFFPTKPAARLALEAAKDFLGEPRCVELIRWVLFDDRTYAIFAEEARQIFGEPFRTE